MHLAESEELEQPEFQYSFNSSQFHSIGRFEKKVETTSPKPSFFVYITHYFVHFSSFLACA